jgi:hypothetical protein
MVATTFCNATRAAHALGSDQKLFLLIEIDTAFYLCGVGQLCRSFQSHLVCFYQKWLQVWYRTLVAKLADEYALMR